jgi:SAM-dependent methyltransferase
MRVFVWPLPALVVWLLSWAVFAAMAAVDASPLLGFALGCAVSVAGTVLGRSLLQRAVLAAGFPLSLAASGAVATIPAWWWLVPVAALFLLYPLRTWQDAPLFPTPPGVLQGLARAAPLGGDRARGGPRILDGGCGLGHGLQALRREYPHAELDGLEWSWPLWLACRLRCPWADVRRGDLWKADWSAYDLVYLFQRPESMPRAVEKARRELRAGAYLVSLEFEAPGLEPVEVLRQDGDCRVYVYRPSARPHDAPHRETLAAPGRQDVIDLDTPTVH